MKSFFFSLLAFVLIFQAQGQSFPKAVQFISSGVDNQYSNCTDLVRDSQGNLIVSGHFNDSVDLGGISMGSRGLLGIVLTDDGFIAKYSPDGNLMWAKQYGANVFGAVDALSLDAQDNIYFYGSARGGFWPDTSAVSLIDTLSNATFFGKLAPDGTTAWLKTIEGDDVFTSIPGFANNRHAIETGPTNELYFYGAFEDDVEFDGMQVVHGSNLTYFLAKYEQDGTFKWMKKLGNRNTPIRGVSVDANGHAFIAGNILADTQLVAQMDTITITTSHRADAFLAKFEPVDGTIMWLKTCIGGIESAAINESTHDVMVHRATGDVYMTGRFGRDTLNFGNGVMAVNEDKRGFDFYLAKFDNNGTALWIEDSRGDGQRAQGQSLDLDSQGNAYVLGTVGIATIGDNPTILGSGASSVTLGHTADEDLFVAKYHSTGGLDWAKFVFGREDDFWGGIAATDNNEAFFSASFQDSVFLEDTVLSSTPGKFKSNGYITRCDGSGTTHIDGITESAWTAYPNPAKDKLFVRSEFGEEAQIRILDMQGRTLIQTNRKSIHIKNMSPGFYLVELRYMGQVDRKKILIQR